METLSEEWKTIPGYEGKYEVSSLGQIRSLRGGKYKNLRYWANWNRYLLVGLSARKLAVHRVVALAFLGPCPKGKECAHLNGDRQDNRAENLRYVTRKENHAHKHLHGTAQKGERGGRAILKNAQVEFIRREYSAGRMNQSELARHFGLSHGTIWSIVRRKTWTHLD